MRQVTKSVNPKEWAVWPLASFLEQLCHYLYEIYDTDVHPALGQSPRDAYHDGFQDAGLRLQRLIPYDHDFLIATLPSTAKGTAMVSPGRGVKINYVVGDHASTQGRHLLSPAHLRELVPDISERDVYICGPVAMIDYIVPNLRTANVGKNHLHVERFAL